MQSYINCEERTDEATTTSWRLRQDIKKRIRNGEIRPGQRLDQRLLAKQLETTTVPLREALSALVNEGLLVRNQGAGIFFKVYTVTEVEELIEIRGMLEALAARRLAARITAGELDELRTLASRLGDPKEAEVEGNFLALHVTFHRRVVELSNSPKLNSMLEFHNLVEDVLANIASTLWEVAAHDHLTIVDSLQSREPDLAEKTMREHIAPSYSERIAWLKEQFGKGPILPITN